MKALKVIKLFSIQVLGILFVFGFSQFGSATYEKIFNHNHVFQAGTIIGSTDVSGLTNEEAVDFVTASLNTWFQSSSLSFHYMEVEKRITPEIFRFSIQKSVDMAGNGQISPLYITIQEPIYKETIHSFKEKVLEDSLNNTKLKKELLDVVTTMRTGNFDFRLLDYISNEIQPESISIGLISLTERQSLEFSKVLTGKNQFELPAMSQFSLLSYINNNAITLSDENLSLLGYALYKTVLNTNFEIMERHTSRQLQDSVELGFEARVTNDNLDLIFFNPNATNFVVNITIQDDVLSMDLVGVPLLFKYEIELKDQKTYLPKSIIQFDPKLPQGTSKIELNGKNGYIVKVIRKKTNHLGDILDYEVVSEDFYPPVHQVVISSIFSKKAQEDENKTEDNDSNLSESEEPDETLPEDVEGNSGNSGK